MMQPKHLLRVDFDRSFELSKSQTEQVSDAQIFPRQIIWVLFEHFACLSQSHYYYSIFFDYSPTGGSYQKSNQQTVSNGFPKNHLSEG